MIQTLTLALLLATSACGGFDTGLNPGRELSKEQGPLVAPPASVVHGAADPGAAQARLPVYPPSRVGGGTTSLRCAPRATGPGSDCPPL